MGDILRKSHFAVRIGVQRQRITALMARGLPVRPDGRIDADAALEWMRANVSQQAGFQDRGIHRIIGTAAKPRKQKCAALMPQASAKANHVPPDESLLGDETAPLPYATAKALRETFLARKARLEFLKENGKLLPADIVESRWAKIFAGVRNRLLACPGRIGSKIPHLSAAEIGAVDKEVRAVLVELGEAPHVDR